MGPPSGNPISKAQMADAWLTNHTFAGVVFTAKQTAISRSSPTCLARVASDWIDSVEERSSPVLTTDSGIPPDGR